MTAAHTITAAIPNLAANTPPPFHTVAQTADKHYLIS
jgi:hypothetical protein